jgi:hypothetical protein
MKTYNPELNPTCPVVDVDANGLHGLAKVDCVTVWFTCWNWNVIVSPGLAVMLLGVKRSFPVPPTTTWWLLLKGGADEVVGGAEEVVVLAVVAVVAVARAAALN